MEGSNWQVTPANLLLHLSTRDNDPACFPELWLRCQYDHLGRPVAITAMTAHVRTPPPPLSVCLHGSTLVGVPGLWLIKANNELFEAGEINNSLWAAMWPSAHRLGKYGRVG